MEEMLIKYNEKYDRWCRSDGKIYRQNKTGEFVECKQTKDRDGYLKIQSSYKQLFSHRLIWETLKGPIPNNKQIDHINNIRDDNKLENLRCVTHKDNCNNTLSIKNRIENSMSDFGKKYYSYYGYSFIKNKNQYKREYSWYRNHNKKCRWEK